MISRSIVLLLLALPALASEAPAMEDAKSPITPVPAPPSPWRIGTGVMWHHIGELSVDPNLQNSSYASHFFIPPPGAGGTDVYANRTYDNGFVNIGAATPASGLTTNWGYQNDTQINGGALTHVLSGGSAQTLPGSGRDAEDTNPAPYLELSYLCPIRPNLIAGFTANLSLVPLDGRTSSTMNNSSVSISDHYALGGIIPPSAPYSGSFTGPGPLIHNQPTSRDFILTPDGTSAYRFSHDTNLYSLAFGGEIHWSPAESFILGFGAGAVLNLADWEASWSAPVSNQTVFRAAAGSHDFLWGLYLKGSAAYRINPQWTIEGFARYDWNETLRASVRPSSFELELTGWSIGFGINYHF